MKLFNSKHSQSNCKDQEEGCQPTKRASSSNSTLLARTRVPILILSFVVLTLFALSFLVDIPRVHALAITSNGTGGGNWNAAATWSGGVIPGAGDTVTLANGDTVTVTDSRSATSVSLAAITAGAGTSTGTLTITSPGSLTLSGTLALPTSKKNSTFNIGGTGSISCANITIGNATVPSGNPTNLESLNLTIASLSVSNNVTLVSTDSGTKVNNAVFSLQSGVATVGGQMITNNQACTDTSLVTLAQGAQTGTLKIAGATPWSLSANGTNTITLNGTSAIVNYNGTSAQTTGNLPAAQAYTTLQINNSAGLTLSNTATAATVTIGNSTSNSILSDGGHQLTSAGTLNLTSGTFKLGAAAATAWPSFATANISSGTTVEYAAAVAQNVSATPLYQNLTFSGLGTKTTATGTITVGGNWTTSGGAATLSTNNSNITVTGDVAGSGAITSGSGTISLRGNWTNNGTFTKDSGTVTYNGTSAQTMGALVYNNLIINKSAGTAYLGGAGTRVDGALTFTSGNIITSTDDLYVSSTGSVSHTSGHIVGNLRKYIATGATSKNFEIGDGLNYAPVSISFGNVTAAGDLTLTTASGDHPNIGTSTITASKTANRYWTTTNSGITFNNYSAVFNFINPGDLDVGANTANFIVGKYSTGTWSYPTVGTRNSTNTQATGLTSFSDFQLGESSDTAPNVPVLVSPGGGSLTNDNTPTLSANYSDPDPGDVGTTNYRIATSAPNCLAGTTVASGTSAVTATNNENTTWTPGSSIGVDATYYWCAQNDDGVALSAWTSMGNFILDTAAPTFTMQYYSDSGLTTPIADNAKLKAGTYYVKITSNEALSATPTVSIAAEGTANDITNGATALVSGNNYKYTRVIAVDAAAVGTVLEDWSVSGTDLASNPATNVNPTNEASKAIYTDTTSPVISLTAPATGAFIKSITSSSSVSYTLSEAISGGTITMAQTSGTPDGSSPHTCTLVGAALNSGAHTAFDMSNTSNSCTVAQSLVDGAVYTFRFDGTDLAGNVATQIVNTSITFDTTGPTVTVNQAVGQADPTNIPAINFTIVFSEPIDPTTFTSADITNSGSATGVTWAAPSTSDNITWTLSSTGIVTNGSVIPSLNAAKVTDRAGNDNAASTSTDNSVVYDTAAPTFTMQYYSDSGLTTPIADNAKLKAGTYYVKITSNEALSATPTVSIAAEGTANDITNGATALVSGNNYKYTRVIAVDAAAVGTVLEDWSVSGTDLASNPATNVNPTNEASKAIYTDTVAPTTPGSLTLGGKTTNTITLNFGAATSEVNFSTYKIFYKQAASGVTESDTEQVDSDLGFINYNSTTNTVVGSLLSGTQYVFNIWAYDTAGNKVNATEITITTVFANNAPNVPILVSPGSGSLINDNTPTLSANYSDPDAGDVGTTNYRIATSVPNCLAGTTVASGTSATTSTNNESTTWTPGSSIGVDTTYYWCAQNDDGVAQSAWTSMGNFILDTSNPTVTVNQAAGQADPTNNPAINFTVIFSEPINPATFTSADITNSGSASGITWSAPSTSDNITWTIATSAITADGTVIPSLDAAKVTDTAGNDNLASTSTDHSVLYDSQDPTFTMQYYYDSSLTLPIADNAKLSAGTYYVKITSNEALFSNPTVSILAEGTANDVTHGATILVSGNIYKYTRTIVTDAAAIGLVMENWSVLGTDLAGNTATDVNPTNELTKDIYTDTVSPTAPGNLTLGGKSSSSITLNFGAATSEVNFDQYKVFYKQAATGVTESDSQQLDSNLGYINYNGVTSTAVSGLSAGTQYVFNIWAYDTVGNKANASEIAISTNPGNNTPNVPTIVSPANGSLTRDTTPTLSANYTDPDLADIGTTDYRIATSPAGCLAGVVVASGTSAVTSTNSEDTVWTPASPISLDATYYWCARNDDGVAQSAWTNMGNFILDTTAPAILITAPTKASNATITDTTVHATDSNGLLAANVTINPSTTAGVTNYNCTQTDANTVDCTIDIVSSGSLAIKAIDNVANQFVQTESGYIINTAAPVIVISAPTKVSNSNISNSTIHVTDVDGVLASNVVIDALNTVSYTSFICTQINTSTVDCTVVITSSGRLVIKATDSLTNSATQPEDSYVIETILPVAIVSAPTKTSTTTITDTKISITDNNAILVANVTVDASSTAGQTNFVCTQADTRTVNCRIDITASGDLVIRAVDSAGNVSTTKESGYSIAAAVAPVIAPTPTPAPAAPVAAPATTTPTTPAAAATVPTVIPPTVAAAAAGSTPAAATPALFDVVANLSKTAQENPIPFTLISIIIVTSVALLWIFIAGRVRRRSIEKRLKELAKSS